MKIAQVIYTGFGGLGSVAFSLIEADKRREHQWSMAFTGDQDIDASYPPRCAQHGVAYAVFRSIPGRPYMAWMRMARWLAQARPDAVICHSINSVLACRWYASFYGKKLITVEHTANAMKSRSEWAASKVSMLLADRVVMLTPEYRDELALVHGRWFRSGKTRLIPNGIDTDLFCPPSRPSEPGADGLLRIGMAARMSFSKRQDLLIRVVEQLAQMRPGLKVQLHLAGDGSEFERVQALARQSPMCESIVFDGLLSESDVAPWMKRQDIYVHATEGETLSTSLLQAMATGLPIVASDIPGVRNLLRAQENYGVCVPNTAQGFAGAILEFLDQPSATRHFGQTARSRALDQYSHEVMLQKYLMTVEGIHA
jgi:glycosyltransferase involved in cell wall biosynthesis